MNAIGIVYVIGMALSAIAYFGWSFGRIDTLDLLFGTFFVALLWPAAIALAGGGRAFERLDKINRARMQELKERKRVMAEVDAIARYDR